MNATANEMPAKLRKQKVYIILRLASRYLTTTNEPVANVIYSNVQLYVLTHIPDSIQGVAEVVLNRLPKSSRADFVTDISQENSIKFFGRKQH